MGKKTIAFVLYSLPCIIALGLMLSDYKTRTEGVAHNIKEIADFVEKSEGLDTLKHNLQSEGQFTNLIEYFELQRKLGVLKETIENIDSQVFGIWQGNSTIVLLMAFLPFLLLGSRLAFDKNVGLDPGERITVARRNLLMKFMVAVVITLGWIYIVNPSGRAATTLEIYLIKENIARASTLPIYIKTETLSNTMAGFLGWYLYLLIYFFRKLYHNDVVSGRVYRFLFGKFLFTYGIALTASVVMGEESQLALFLIGFFPLSAISIIKEYGTKAVKGANEGKATLAELPSISLWHTMRLEEEGVDSISTLANYELSKLQSDLPKVMRPLVELWIDVAQLYTILGVERYQTVKPICSTASEFIRKAKNEKFQAKLKEVEVVNYEEIARLIERTFAGNLIPAKT